MKTLSELLAALRESVSFRLRMLRFALTVKPFAGGDGGDDEDDKDGDKDGDDDSSSDDDSSDDDSSSDDKDDDEDDDSSDDDEDDDEKPYDRDKDPDWKVKARREERERKQWEARAKAAEKERDALKKKTQTEQERAVEKAKREGREEAEREFKTERQSTSLDSEVTKQATRGITVQRDGKDKTLVFNDPDDALGQLERRLSEDEMNALFDDDGKIDSEAVGEALRQMAEDKPHWVKDAETRPPPKGGADGRKGGGKTDKSLEEMSPADHLQDLNNPKAA